MTPTEHRRELARERQRRKRARDREARAAAATSAGSLPPSAPRPAGWAPDPTEPWWDRPEAAQLRRAWFGRGLRLPMTGGQCRLLARWARRGRPFRELCRTIAGAPRSRGSTYGLVARALAAAIAARIRRDPEWRQLALDLEAPIVERAPRSRPARDPAPPGAGAVAWLQLGIAWGLR